MNDGSSSPDQRLDHSKRLILHASIFYVAETMPYTALGLSVQSEADKRSNPYLPLVVGPFSRHQRDVNGLRDMDKFVRERPN